MLVRTAMETERIVLLVDMDAFFCQVEELKNPSLQGLPIAVQQHQDIIAVNYPARSAGVKKHMAPSEARQVLGRVGGRLVHVHSEAGGRISYKPYRRKGAQLLQLLQNVSWAASVEQASIDEAFIEVHPCISGLPPGANASDLSAVACALAQDLRARVLQDLGLKASVGVAPNKLLAKLAAAAAKPDGIKQALLPADIHHLLTTTPAAKLPGMGGKTAEAFAQCGIRFISDLEQYSVVQLQQMLGVKPTTARQLHEWGRGVDSSPVKERPPPKTLSLQMSLTPTLRPMHHSLGQVSASGGKAGLLEPMVVGSPEYGARLALLAADMAAELLERVQEDREQHARWPRSMAVSLQVMGGGRDAAFATATCSWPSPAIEAGTLQHAVEANFQRLASQASSGYPPHSKLVELRLAATAFGSFQAAAAAPPITSHFQLAAARDRHDGNSGRPSGAVVGSQGPPDADAVQHHSSGLNGAQREGQRGCDHHQGSSDCSEGAGAGGGSIDTQAPSCVRAEDARAGSFGASQDVYGVRSGECSGATGPAIANPTSEPGSGGADPGGVHLGGIVSGLAGGVAHQIVAGGGRVGRGLAAAPGPVGGSKDRPSQRGVKRAGGGGGDRGGGTQLKMWGYVNVKKR